MLKRIACAVGLLAAVASVPATAATVTFEDLASGPQPTPLTDGGLTFVNTGGMGTNGFYIGSGQQSGNGTNVLIPNSVGSTTTVTAANGSPFTLSSLDIGDVYNYGVSEMVTFTFTTLTGAPTTQTITLDSMPGLQTFAFDIANLTSFSYSASGDPNGNNFAQIDNVVYAAGVMSSVPELASWAMMIAGTGLIGLTLRRRRDALGTAFVALGEPGSA